MTKKIKDWSFETKYDLLGHEEKLLHQVRLIRADIGTLVYITLCFLFQFLAFIVRCFGQPDEWIYGGLISLIGFSILGYGGYRHHAVRAKLYSRFEHQRAYL